MGKPSLQPHAGSADRRAVPARRSDPNLSAIVGHVIRRQCLTPKLRCSDRSGWVAGRAMDTIKIFHNPVCGKSRGALEILRERGLDPLVVEYLKTPLDRETLEHILDLLPGAPAELVRKDKRFKELGLDPQAYEARDAVIEILLQHPELMERPVVLRGERAVIARPSEKVLDILS